MLCERYGTSIGPNINNTCERRGMWMLLIYYLLQDNKSFLFNDQLVVVIYQTSCKVKLQKLPYTCIYISKDMCNLHNSNAQPNREMARRVTNLVVYGTPQICKVSAAIFP